VVLMPHWLLSHPDGVGAVAAKAALIYLITLAGLRIAHRRTVAQWSAIDFAAAVGIGSILGRTAVAPDQSVVVGTVAMGVILGCHWLATIARYRPVLARILDHRVRVLVDHGVIRQHELRASGLTEADLHAQLRQQGVDSVLDPRWVIYEIKGQLSVFREPNDHGPDPVLIREISRPRDGAGALGGLDDPG
jgi:uncharacterized membrane protein YcaP (DUF421 family)